MADRSNAAATQNIPAGTRFAASCGATAATGSGGILLAFIAYWFLSLIRDRKSTDSLMNLHGSATWATRNDIKLLGLLDATDGVYVGGWRDI